MKLEAYCQEYHFSFNNMFILHKEVHFKCFLLFFVFFFLSWESIRLIDCLIGSNWPSIISGLYAISSHMPTLPFLNRTRNHEKNVRASIHQRHGKWMNQRHSTGDLEEISLWNHFSRTEIGLRVSSQMTWKKDKEAKGISQDLYFSWGKFSHEMVCDLPVMP